jgi:hypothetical protein
MTGRLRTKRTTRNASGKFKLDAKTARALKYFLLLVVMLVALVLAIIIIKGRATI